MAAEREGWRRAPPTLGMSNADIRRRPSAWLPLAVWRSQLHGLRSSSRRECVDWEAYGGDLSGVAQSERRFFTHEENLKKCMMGGGGITFLYVEREIIRS